MNTLNEGDLMSRVAILERKLHRLRQVTLLAGITLAGVASLGQVPTKPAVQKSIEAEGFALRKADDPGPRALLGVTKAGANMLTFYRSDGGTALTLGCTRDNHPVIDLFDGGKTSRASLTLDDSGAPSVALMDGRGKQRVALAIAAENVGLRIFDGEGRNRAVIGYDGTSGKVVVWNDKNETIFEQPASVGPAKQSTSPNPRKSP